MLRATTLLLVTGLLVPGLARAQAPLLDLAAGNLRLTVGAGDNVKLYVRGVPVIHRSTMYLVKPRWTAALLNQDTITPKVSSTTEGNAKIGIAEYESERGYARYRYELRPDDTMKVTVRFGLHTEQPAEVEYDAGYINANLIKGMPYMAETVEGPRSGEVPLFPASADQTESRLTPPLKSIRLSTVIGTINIKVEGSSDITSAFNLFDARGETADWARKNPVFWFGIGSPSPNLPAGENTVTVTWSFGLPSPNATIPSVEGQPKMVPVAAAQVPYIPDRPVIPRPKEMSGAGTAVRLTPGTRIVIPDNPSEPEKKAARELFEDLRTYWGVTAPIRRASAAKTGTGPDLRVGTVKASAFFGDGFNAASVPDNEEGYFLAVQGKQVIVAGRTPIGAYYGAQTLRQLIRVDAKGSYVKPATIKDWPSLKFRGVHWFGGQDSWPFHQKMISRIIAPFKMNAMVYQADYTQWESQPEVWSAERSTPKAMVRRSVDYAREHFLEPIPMVNGMGHAEWLFWNKKNLDLAADKDQPYAYDPTNPRTYDVLFKIYEETIDLFKPRYFHLGNDEVTMTGRFPPPGVEKTVTELIIEDTTKRHNWLKERGIETMMWGDMLLYRDEANDAGLAPTPEDAAARRKALPKDIIMADWHYTGSDPNYRSVPLLQGAGYRVIGTGWFTWANIRNWASELVKYKSMGYLQSTWAGYNMFPDIVKGESANQFVAYVLGAEYAWNGGSHEIRELGYSPDDVFQSIWNRQAAPVATRPGIVLDLSPISNVRMWDWVRALPGAKPVATKDKVPTGRLTVGGVTFQMNDPVWMAGSLNPGGAWPKSTDLDMDGRKMANLHFLWGTTYSAEMRTPVANLTVAYTDGKTEVLEISYGREIFAFDDMRAGPDTVTVWRGDSPFGEEVALRRWMWNNPRPNVGIQSVQITSLESAAAPVLVSVTGITS